MHKPNNHDVTTYPLFIGVIFVWALSWPISKIGLTYITSYWFALYRTVLGFITVSIVLYINKDFSLPKRKDLPIIFSIGALEMGMAVPLIALGLSYIDTARSALLLYTSSLWATPIAYLVFDEKISTIKLVGLIIGVTGLLLLFNPSSFDWSNKNVLIGNGCIITAAILWAIVILHTRYGKWISQPISLLPYQLLLGTSIILICAVIVDPHPHITWNMPLILSLLYNGIFACAFGYFAATTVTRRLPVISTSIGFMAVPVFGIISSTIVFHGNLTVNFISACICILFGILIVSVEPRYTIQKLH